MKANMALLGLMAVMALAGCGGSGNAAPGTRGEGNIPIGRIRAVGSPVARVVATGPNGTSVTAYSDADGVFSMPMLQYGPTTFDVQPLSADLAPQTLQVVIGAAQANIMDVDLTPKKTDATVDSIVIDLPNRKSLKVGVAVPYKVTVNGRNVNPLTPSVWVDCGRGHLEFPNKFVPDTAGDGRIGAELLGKTAYLDITVK